MNRRRELHKTKKKFTALIFHLFFNSFSKKILVKRNSFVKKKHKVKKYNYKRYPKLIYKTNTIFITNLSLGASKYSFIHFIWDKEGSWVITQLDRETVLLTCGRNLREFAGSHR